MKLKSVKKVGTWVLAVTPAGEIMKWGKDGDTEFPDTEKQAVARANRIIDSPTHKDDRFYILHVFSNGQIEAVRVRENLQGK